MPGKTLRSVGVAAALALLAACSGTARPDGGSAGTGTPGAVTPASGASQTANTPSAFAPSSAASSALATTTPAAGAQLLQERLDGDVRVIFGDTGFSVLNEVQDSSTATESGTITTYGTAGNKVATISDVDANCGAEDILLPSGRRVVLALTHDSKPAEGVNPATVTIRLNEFDAGTARRLWSVTLIDKSTDAASPDLASCITSNSDGTLWYFSVTADRAYGVDSEVWGMDTANPASIINLSTGTTRTSSTVTGTVGDVIENEEIGPDSNHIYFSDPATGARTGTLPGNDDKDLDNGKIYASRASLIYAPDSGHNSEIVALSLPGAAPAWTAQDQYEVSDISVTGQIVIASNHYETQSGVAGYSLTTGKLLWVQPTSDLCYIYNGKVGIEVNDQIAVLNATTGKQISYQDTNSCPNFLPNGITWSYDNGLLTVTQESPGPQG